MLNRRPTSKWFDLSLDSAIFSGRTLKTLLELLHLCTNWQERIRTTKVELSQKKPWTPMKFSESNWSRNLSWLILDQIDNTHWLQMQALVQAQSKEASEQSLHKQTTKAVTMPLLTHLDNWRIMRRTTRLSYWKLQLLCGGWIHSMNIWKENASSFTQITNL